MIHVCLKRIQQTFSPHGPLPPNANKYGKKGDVFFYKGIYCFFFTKQKKSRNVKKKHFFTAEFGHFLRTIVFLIIFFQKNLQ